MKNRYETRYRKDITDFLGLYKKIRNSIDYLILSKKLALKDKKIKNAIRYVDNIIVYLTIHNNIRINNIFKYVYLMTKLDFKNKIVVSKLSKLDIESFK